MRTGGGTSRANAAAQRSRIRAGVNVSTIFLAQPELRDKGLLTFRGSGVTAAGAPERALVGRQARKSVTSACRHGYRRAGLPELVEGLLGGQRAQ